MMLKKDLIDQIINANDYYLQKKNLKSDKTDKR